MTDFHYAEAVAAAANKDYLCDRCRKAKKCKDYTGIDSNKGYHHIYCNKYQVKTVKRR